ncbi:hypothetical protein MWU52_08735 [Jannaschia sp. S6380]|uniref:hypothetical protein n=1 Tax=Jannaschia sp. S6380 TaxID=2926408 RepID=UPI001FF6BEA0|nr:hypothetical protein [Jannaschia sp. S6380]MCK0167630.1 hypothetical protein [Jannaschia sp. S6380]
MVIAVGSVLYGLAFWVPTLLPRWIGLGLALVLLAGCVVLIVSSVLHAPSRTHFDIEREAGIATGLFFVMAPIAAILFLTRVPEAKRTIEERVSDLLAAVLASFAAGTIAFFNV